MSELSLGFSDYSIRMREVENSDLPLLKVSQKRPVAALVLTIKFDSLRPNALVSYKADGSLIRFSLDTFGP